MGKGNGKSPMMGGIGLFGLHADGEHGAQVYAAGATRDQAKVLFADAVKMVRQSPALASRLEFSGGAGRENNIAHLVTASFFRPVSRETKRSGSGPRPHFALVDELHEHPDSGTLDILERGFKFRRQPLLVMMTNSGSDRKSICWQEHQHAIRVAAGTMTPGPDHTYVGEAIDDTTFSYVCALDNDDDPLNDPTCWIKANPMLGVILQPEEIQKAVNHAKNMPGKRNSILRLHFCVWTDADSAWIGGETLRRVLADFDPAEHAGKPIYLGVDLSGHKDLTAVAHIVQTGTPPNPSRSSVDFTHLKSPNKTREHKPSMIEPGEATVVLNYNKATRVKIDALFVAEGIQEFQIGYPDGATETFSGFLTGKPTEGVEVEGKLTLNCPIKVTGLPVYDEGE